MKGMNNNLTNKYQVLKLLNSSKVWNSLKLFQIIRKLEYKIFLRSFHFYNGANGNYGHL